MWVGRADYDLVAAFLCGYGHALHGGLLAGFHEWITMRYGRGHNLAWPALLKYEIVGYPKTGDELEEGVHDQLLLDQLRDLLVEFLRERSKIGVRNIYYDHGKSIRQFD